MFSLFFRLEFANVCLGSSNSGSGMQETFVSTIEMQVEKQDERIKIPVQFIDSQYVDALLGQEGFFDHYRIKFEKDHDTFEITPAKKK